MTLASIGIIVALPEEFNAVRAMLTAARRHRVEGPGGGREYLLGEIASARGGVHHLVVAQTMAMGNNSAALRASKMLEAFDGLDAIIMCGIAGGVPNPDDPPEHVRLGDVVVSDRVGVVQYDLGKDRGASFEPRHAPRPPSARLLEAVQILEQDRHAGLSPWDQHLRNALAACSITRPAPSSDVILDAAGDRIDHPPLARPSPWIFHGPVASANVVQADFEKRDRLRDLYKIKAVEMEGSGVADATWEYEKAGYLVVRGICDYCDARTKATQTDAWKPYAAMAAAAYVRALIEMMPGTKQEDSETVGLRLSTGAERLLRAAATAKRQTVTINSTMHGLRLGTGDAPLVETDDDREKAECRGWIDELVRAGLIEDRWHAGQVYAVTPDGYLAADKLGPADPPLDTT